MPADTYGAHGPGRCAIGYRHRRRLLNCSLAGLLLSLSDRSGGARRLGTLTCELLQLISRLHSLSPCSSPPLVFFRCALRVVVGGEGNPDTAGGWSSELKRVSLASSLDAPVPMGLGRWPSAYREARCCHCRLAVFAEGRAPCPLRAGVWPCCLGICLQYSS